MLKRLPLIFEPQPEGGYTVTSPVLPELYANVADALAAVAESTATSAGASNSTDDRLRGTGFQPVSADEITGWKPVP